MFLFLPGTSLNIITIIDLSIFAFAEILPLMVNRKSGHIVAVSSIQGRVAIPFRSAYSASKHALQAFCDSMRPEIARHNVHVTVVTPGYVQTSLSINAVTGSGQKYGGKYLSLVNNMLVMRYIYR